MNLKRYINDLSNVPIKGRKDLKCPKCDARMKLKLGKFGRFYGCSKYPECTCTIDADDKTGEPRLKTQEPRPSRLQYLLDPNWDDL